MAQTLLDDRQVVNRAALAAIGSAAGTTLDVIMGDINTLFANATSAATASVIMKRDANANTQANNFIPNFTTTATATGTTTLTVSSSYFQQFTGTQTQIVVLPNATTLVVGQSFLIVNRSTGNVTLETNGGATLQILTANSQAHVTVSNIGTSAGTWDVDYTITGPIPFLQTQVTTDSTTTGTAATLLTADISFGTTRLTNASLVSVSGIPAGASGQQIIVENQTGTTIVINNNDAGATAANRIFTGTGGSVSMSNNASFEFVYDTTQSRWMLVGGTGSGSGSGGSKNYLSAITTSQSTTPNSGNGNFELGSATGWDWCNVGTLTNGLPTGTPNFTSVNTNPLYSFTISTSTTCAAGDTYTNNSQTFTVVTALSAQSGTVFFATGTGDPTASGTLTRATGAGTSSITFSAFTKETISVVSSGQLAGSYSLSLATSAATVAGLGFCSDAFNIDTEDQAKVLTWKFYYKAQTNPSNANWSGTSSNSFGVAVYDVTNSTFLPTTAAFGMTQNSGVGYVTGTVQTGSSTTQMRLIVYNMNPTSGAVTLYFDDFSFGPQTAPIGSIVTDWQTYTPTGTWTTNTTYSGLWRRVGDSMEIVFKLTLSGAPTNTSLHVNIPTGYTIDTTKIPNFSNINGYLGRGAGASAGASYDFYVGVNGSSTNSFFVGYDTNASPGSLLGQFSSTAPATWASGDNVNGRLLVPIVGWSSNTQMSNDTDTRVVAMRAGGNQSGTISTGASNPVTWGTTSNDTHGAFNGTTYTVPVTGYYDVSALVTATTTTFTSANRVAAQILANGSEVGRYSLYSEATVANPIVSLPVSMNSIFLNAGQTLQINFFPINGTWTYQNTESSFFTVSRRSGPSVIAATESVNMAYTDTSGQSIGTAAGIFKFATKLYDSHSAYNSSTGLYTVPVSGKYRVSSFIVTAAVTLSTSQSMNIYVLKNGSPLAQDTRYGTGANVGYLASVVYTVNCLAGDTISIDTNASVATNGATGANLNNLCIERVGN